MRLIALGSAAVGERLAVDIRDPVGRTLLAAGTALTAGLIARLLARGYQSIGVIDPLAPDVVPTEPLRAQTRQVATEAVRACLGAAGAGGRIAVTAAMRAVIDDILRSITGSGQVAMCLVGLRSLENYTFVHSVNVCVFSVLLGAALALDRADMRHLGLGALLHDIGKIYYMDLVQKIGPLTSDEFERLKRHPGDGFEILRRQQEIDLRSAHVAFQHHERLDGSGYPRSLRGRDIHPWAQVTAVADIYDTITSDRSYGRGQPPAAALEELRGMADRGLLDQYLVRYFVERITAYPDGSIVRLETGEVAVVVGQSAMGARWPRLRVVASPDLQLVEPQERDAAPGSPQTRIAAVLADYPEDLRRRIIHSQNQG